MTLQWYRDKVIRFTMNHTNKHIVNINVIKCEYVINIHASDSSIAKLSVLGVSVTGQRRGPL